MFKCLKRLPEFIVTSNTYVMKLIYMIYSTSQPIINKENMTFHEAIFHDAFLEVKSYTSYRLSLGATFGNYEVSSAKAPSLNQNVIFCSGTVACNRSSCFINFHVN